MSGCFMKDCGLTGHSAERGTKYQEGINALVTIKGPLGSLEKLVFSKKRRLRNTGIYLGGHMVNLISQEHRNWRETGRGISIIRMGTDELAVRQQVSDLK